MAKIDINTLLTKISHVFLRDAFIIKNNFVIGGEETSDETAIESFIELGLDYIPVLTSSYPDVKKIYIDNIKEAKKDLDTHIKSEIPINLLEYSDKKYKKLKEIIDSIESWDMLNLTEEEITDIYENGTCIELFKNDKRYPVVIVGKKMFPMVTAKNIDKVVYSVIKDKKIPELYTLVTKLGEGSMTIYNVIKYIKI